MGVPVPNVKVMRSPFSDGLDVGDVAGLIGGGISLGMASKYANFPGKDSVLT